jgi:hypothetical protein
MRNNLFLASDDAGAICLDTNATRFTLDYNGWYLSPSASNFGRISGVTYATLAAFQAAGQEAHGKLVNYSIFTNAAMPTRAGQVYPFTGGFSAPYTPGAADVTLKAGTNAAVDAGTNMPNVTEGFAGTAPDLGAYERGSTVPIYGPAGITGGTPNPTVPAAASNCTATALAGVSIQVNFSDNSSNEDGFKVERSIAGAPFATLTTLAANTASYTDTGLTDGISYSYRIVAFNSVGDAAPSNTANATAVVTPPAGATPPTASGGGGGGCAATESGAAIVLLLLMLATFARRRFAC